MIDWVQYCIKLREGKDAGIRYYVRASKDEIQSIFDSCKIGGEVSDAPYSIDMCHIAGNDTKHGEKSDKADFNMKNLGSLVFDCKNEETANKCAKYLKLPLPFPNYK